MVLLVLHQHYPLSQGPRRRRGWDLFSRAPDGAQMQDNSDLNVCLYWSPRSLYVDLRLLSHYLLTKYYVDIIRRNCTFITLSNTRVKIEKTKRQHSTSSKLTL